MFYKLIAITLTAFTLFAAATASAKESAPKKVDVFCISGKIMSTDSEGMWVLIYMASNPTSVTCKVYPQKMMGKTFEVSGVKFRKSENPDFTWVMVKSAESAVVKK